MGFIFSIYHKLASRVHNDSYYQSITKEEPTGKMDSYRKKKNPTKRNATGQQAYEDLRNFMNIWEMQITIR